MEQRFIFKSSKKTGFFWDGELLEKFYSPYQEVMVFNHPEMGNTLVLGGYIMVTQQDEYQYHELITHPNCMQLKKFDNALIIGGGDGLCAEELLKYPFTNVTQVEIDKAVSDMGQKYFGEQLGNTFNDKRYHPLFQDALQYFPTPEKYDFIALDLNDPEEETMPSHPLYSGEFYQTCKNHLDTHGIMVVQVGCPYLFTHHFKRNVQLLQNMFKSVVTYGMFMRCYGTYQYFAACSDTLDLSKPQFNDVLPIGFNELKLYNKDMHQAMLVQSNEIKNILNKA